MGNKYKLNLHAHTKYSDGQNTILEMAEMYKELGHTCAVISDHCYGWSAIVHYSMTREKFLKAIVDAKEAEQKLGFPVIIGMEYNFFRCEEVLCFGREFLMRLYDGVSSVEEFIQLRCQYPSACVLCHPCLKSGDNGFIAQRGHLCIDGFEHYNHGQNMFLPEWRSVPGEFEDLTAFSNSDAHGADRLSFAHNLVDSPIKNESDLISYVINKRPVLPITFDRAGETFGENDPIVDIF